MLHRIVETIYYYLEDAKKFSNSNIVSNIEMIKKQCNLSVLRFNLEPEDVDAFIRNFVKYMMKYSTEKPHNITEDFNLLIANIIQTSKIIDTPAIRFLNNQDRDDFNKGFLLYE